MTKQLGEPIVIVGTIGFDTVITPYGKAEEVLGGSAMFSATAASMLAPVNVVSVVGEDFDCWEKLARRNLDLEGVATLPGKTFRWGGQYGEDINRRDTLFTEQGVLERFDPVLPENYRKCKTVFLANVDPLIQLKVLESLEEPGFVVCDTMNFWIKNQPEPLERIISCCDVLILNDDEARLLTGKLNLIAALEEIQARGPHTVVLKKGEHGAIMASGEELFAVPGYPLKKVVDPTGAGDTFAGGFVGYIQSQGCRSIDVLRKAVVYGSVLASFCCEDFSAERLKKLNFSQIEARVQEFRQLVRFD